MSKKEQKSFNEELDKLFDQWINEIEKNIANSDEEDQYREGGTGKVIFTRDGLLEKNDPSIDVYQDWVNASRRILFLLKDQPTEWCDDVRLWLKDLGEAEQHAEIKKRNRELGTGFIRNIANIFYGLANATAEEDCAFEQLTYDDVALCFNTRPFGILETKKQGGGSSLGNTELNRCLYTYESFIVRQLEIMQPNICVSTSPIITSFLKKRAGSVVTFGAEHWGMFYSQFSKILYLTSYHPSARKSYPDFYERLMNDFRYFLRSEYAKEFLGQKEA